MTKICVLGLGHIGLPTALLLATNGYEVRGVDVKQDIIDSLNRGRIPFNEAGLAELLSQAKKYFSAQREVEEADVFLIAVPTPLEKSRKVADLSYVRLAAEAIYPHLKKGNLVILESTVPPGTSEKVVIPILEKSGLEIGEFYFAHCPERAIPGMTIKEMIHNDRVIGVCDERSAELVREIYSSFVKGDMHVVDLRTAEFVKLIENTYRDVNIALANELALVAEEYGVNVWQAIEIANKHPRVNILRPGPGVGGDCIPVDPWLLAENSSKCRMITLARRINDSMPNHVLEILKTFMEPITGEELTVTVFGVAYKGNVEDTRESPALKFIELAQNHGIRIKCYDPHVKDFKFQILDLEEAVKDSDCIVVIADHKLFRNIDPEEVGNMMRKRNLVDTRNLLSHDKWRKAGFRVMLLGEGTEKYRRFSRC